MCIIIHSSVVSHISANIHRLNTSKLLNKYNEKFIKCNFLSKKTDLLFVAYCMLSPSTSPDLEQVNNGRLSCIKLSLFSLYDEFLSGLKIQSRVCDFPGKQYLLNKFALFFNKNNIMIHIYYYLLLTYSNVMSFYIYGTR